MYVSVGFDGEHESWLDTSAGGLGAYNAAVRNFAYSEDDGEATVVNAVPVPLAAWTGLVMLGGLAVRGARRKRLNRA